MPNFQKPGGDKHVTDEMIYKASITIDEYMTMAPAYNANKYKGRGIVMVAGGEKYLPCAYVCVRMIRSNGCKLPIQIWHIGAMEADTTVKALFDGMGVEFVDCMDVIAANPCRRVGGWEMNPYAIIHSRFREVVFLDADNIPLINVETMFEWEEYKQRGAVFWPDYGRLDKTRSIWRLLDIEYRDEPEFESGQIVVDKRRCWKELQLTMCLNEHSDTYYQHVWGDKETYHMAWRYLQTEYAMVPTAIRRLKSTMCQHDFNGNIVLQHRNMDKFSLTKRNLRIPGFQREAECLEYLEDLRNRWIGTISAPVPETPAEKEAYGELAGKFFDYDIAGRPGRTLELLGNGMIGHGALEMERGWYVREQKDGVVLYITGRGVTATLQRNGNGLWDGRWLNNEMFKVALRQGPGPLRQSDHNVDMEAALAGTTFTYVRTGFDMAVLTLMAGHQVAFPGSNEKAWWVETIHGVNVLFIGKGVHTEPICMLQLCRDGIWRGYWTKHETMHIELIPKEK